jgi:hypothetical protein
MWRETNGGGGISAGGTENSEYPNTNGYHQYGIITRSLAKIYNIKSAPSPPKLSYQFNYVIEAGPAGTCANFDCNQGMVNACSIYPLGLFCCF